MNFFFRRLQSTKPTMKKRLPLLSFGLLAAAIPPAPAQQPAPASSPGYVEAFRPSPGNALADRQARTGTRLGQRLIAGETQLLANFRGLYNEVWHNADGLTPQQVCDALGTRAGSLFVIAGTMANALYQIDPAGLGSMVNVPAGYTAAIHDDGTVAITYTAPAPISAPTPAP